MNSSDYTEKTEHSLIIEIEMDGLAETLPGKRYRTWLMDVPNAARLDRPRVACYAVSRASGGQESVFSLYRKPKDD